MTRPLFTSHRLRFALVLVLVVVCLLPTAWARDVAAGPRFLVREYLLPLAAPLTMISQRLRPEEETPPPAGTREQYAEVLVQRDALMQELKTTREQLALYGALTQKIGRARLYVTARVVAVNPDAAIPTLTINVGTRAGVQQGMAVVDARHFQAGVNLVGRVIEAGPGTATVRYLTARGLPLQAELRPPTPAASDNPPVVTPEPKGEVFTARVKKNSGVKPGWLAHLRVGDDAWRPALAAGLLIGQVEEVKPADNDPFMFDVVVIRPAAPLRVQDQVVVLVPTDGAGR